VKRLISFVTIVAAAFALTGGTAFATTGSATFGEAGVTGCETFGEHGTATWDTATATVDIRARKLSRKTEYSVEIVIGCNLGNAAEQVLGTLTTNGGGNGSGSYSFTPDPRGALHFRLVPVGGGTQFYTGDVNLSP
jgi:hypothetical protein